MCGRSFFSSFPRNVWLLSTLVPLLFTPRCLVDFISSVVNTGLAETKVLALERVLGLLLSAEDTLAPLAIGMDMTLP